MRWLHSPSSPIRSLRSNMFQNPMKYIFPSFAFLSPSKYITCPFPNIASDAPCIRMQTPPHARMVACIFIHSQNLGQETISIHLFIDKMWLHPGILLLSPPPVIFRMRTLSGCKRTVQAPVPHWLTRSSSYWGQVSSRWSDCEESIGTTCSAFESTTDIRLGMDGTG